MERRCCLVVGADRLGAVPRLKAKLGVDEVVHWNGRFRKPPKALPRGVDTVIIYTGFVSHTAMHTVKRLAKSRGVRTVFLNRGLTELDA